MTDIDSTSIISPKAELATGVKVGPYSVIGDNVTIGEDTVIGPHVVIEGHTNIGNRNRISHFVSIGTPPQDTSYKNEDTRVVIGNDNVIREFATINRASTKENWVTKIGNNNFLMSYSHVAHDCTLGNHIIMANVANLGGHTSIGDYTNLSAFAGVHQFVRIGAYAFIGGRASVAQDVPPFMIAVGTERAKLFGPNQTGLKRQGFSRETIDLLKKAYRVIWRKSKGFNDGIKKAREEIDAFPELDLLIDFILTSKRGVIR